jgi:protein SCO1/2
VSITVDPERDTPARLSEYAGRFGADPTRWWFLTGDSREIQRVVVDGFKVQLRRDGAGIGDVMHGNWFVLVDQAGNMRGAYLATDDASLRALVDDARALAQR